MLGARDRRAFCRPPMGVAVAFAGVSTYPDDGTLVCGLFDRPILISEGYGRGGGILDPAPQIWLPSNAFSTMPASGDQIVVTDEGLSTTYKVDAPTAEDDGGFLVYQLHGTGIPPVATLQASAANGQSIASDVLDAIVTQLGGNPQAFRTRFRNFGQGELPADNVLPDTEDPEPAFAGQTDQKLRLFVRHMVSGNDDNAERLADQRFVRGQKLLLADPTLGGLVRALRYEGRKWEIDDRESENVVCVATYEAEFSTSPRDPSVAGF